MKKFRFRLERILHYRKLVSDEKRKVLLEKRMAHRESEDYLEKLQADRESNHSPEGTDTVESFYLRGLFTTGTIQRIEKQHHVIAECLVKVEEAEEEYLEAVKELKALEKLKQRRLEEFQEEFARHEQQELDEVVTSQANRKRHVL
jgi:flagellar protein FliJ